MRRPSIAVTPTFPTWRTLTLGTHRNIEDLSIAIQGKGFTIGHHAEEFLQRTPLAGRETEIDLVLVSVADLGFTDASRRDAIYNRANALGLALVPAEVGPLLRLRDCSHPWQLLMIGMEPIADSNGWLAIFGVEHGSSGLFVGWWLNAFCGSPAYTWQPYELWVFTRRRAG